VTVPDPAWSDPSTPSPRVVVHCAQCRRAMRELAWDPTRGTLLLIGSLVPEGSMVTINGKSSPRRRARWWDHSPDGWNPDRLPSLYGYDCGGRHRGTAGRITAVRLTRLYLEAATRGERDIFI
jgi:hypothetical protein